MNSEVVQTFVRDSADSQSGRPGKARRRICLAAGAAGTYGPREQPTQVTTEITTLVSMVGQERSSRCKIGKLIGVVSIPLASCSGAPGQNILGSYFPSWMLCALAGLGAAIVLRLGLIAAGIDKILPAPLLVYLALAVFFAFAAWLVWLA
jgi:hypothetical protein